MSYLTVAELSQRYKIQEKTIYNMNSSKRIPVRKVGKKVLYKESELTSWENIKESLNMPVVEAEIEATKRVVANRSKK